jgi:hypothetical protein
MRIFSSFIERKQNKQGSILELLYKFAQPTNNYFEHFQRLAQQLINNYILTKGNAQYSINEIEIYYNNETDHRDLFTHSSIVQKNTGRWYFHNTGVDITFGNESAYGGILVRGITKMGDPKFINGPSKVFEELFQDGGAVDGNDINKVVITPNTTPEQKYIISGPRSGIRIIASETNNEDKHRYLFKPYRFIAIDGYSQYSEKYLMGLYQVKVLKRDFRKVATRLMIDKPGLASNCEYFDKGISMNLDKIFSLKQSVEKNCMLFGHLSVIYGDKT